MADDYAEDWKLLFLVLIASASFYFLSVVTEERFVPALNVISKRLKMSDDVAGATLMAAGASSPELFAAMISVFVTHSALGIGTVVGSEVRVMQMLNYLDDSWTCH
jgi:Ca2+/Na+ antiporter